MTRSCIPWNAWAGSGKLALLCLLAAATCLPARPLGAAPPVDFNQDVRAILERACFDCHGPDKQQGGLRLDRRASALKAADSGAVAVVPKDPSQSELLARVAATEAAVRMPLKRPPLEPAQIELLRTWIEQGAPWPEEPSAARPAGAELKITEQDRRHWAYRPLQSLAPPAPRDPGWCRTPVDLFIQQSLEQHGLRANPSADRGVLIRRLWLDLLGLPPAPEEVAAFMQDERPGAYEALVDRALANPHYGERWGRHWLDVARYADSDGLETDADRPDAWPYRDFVIAALNEDLPWNTMVRWQIAGDELEPDEPRALAATGFLTGAPVEFLMVPMEEEKLRLRFNELDDMAVTTISAFLGLTLGCARCHDHKFDAIPMRDYYRLQCAFMTTARDHRLLTTREQARQYRLAEAEWKSAVETARKRLDDWLDEHKQPHKQALRDAKIAALSIGDEQKTILREQPDSDAAKRLFKQHERALALTDEDFRRVFSDQERQTWDRLLAALQAARQAQPARPPTALAIIDRQPRPDATYLLDRGDFYARKEPVQLGFLSVLTGARSPDDYWAAAKSAIEPETSTGQRRALADWITDTSHGAGALAARVIVNRVWQHHFGEGLTRTPTDFGVRGEEPTHPELLEWLARGFVEHGWSLKWLHRQILTSAVYTQSTGFDAARHALDPENRLLWRRRPRRIEAEILRDCVLAASGTLNPAPYGPAFKPFIPEEAMLARNTKDPYPKNAPDDHTTRRRSVYMFHKRVVQYPLMQAFDGPDGAVSCGRRSTTTVAPQALALLNDGFLRRRAVDFARRVLAEAGPDAQRCVSRAYWLAVAREPLPEELRDCAAFIERQSGQRAQRDSGQGPRGVHPLALADFCQALFSLNEFIYVD